MSTEKKNFAIISAIRLFKHNYSHSSSLFYLSPVSFRSIDNKKKECDANWRYFGVPEQDNKRHIKQNKNSNIRQARWVWTGQLEAVIRVRKACVCPYSAACNFAPWCGLRNCRGESGLIWLVEITCSRCGLSACIVAWAIPTWQIQPKLNERSLFSTQNSHGVIWLATIKWFSFALALVELMAFCVVFCGKLGVTQFRKV